MEHLYLADNMLVLQELEENSFDSCVTDPPYGIKFMNNRWDYDIPSVALWKELLRILKPGSHILVFGGTRTQHRMASNIEDAGFEIRDVISWIYGQGFPKGKMLKPACELITLARKPISEKTVLENIAMWGVGNLNIDETRIELNGEVIPINVLESWSGFGELDRPKYTPTINTRGRWPSNVILDEESAILLDEQSGYSKSSKARSKILYDRQDNVIYGKGLGTLSPDNTYDDFGGASRFFYCAKPNQRERGESNQHPTVKPIRLLEYLVKLATPIQGVCIDPFMGSGTTGVACKNLDINFVGIEKEVSYFETSQNRLKEV